MNTKARGMWANFQSTCHRCQGVLTITNGRVDNHDCRPPQPKTLAEIRAALDAKGAS